MALNLTLKPFERIIVNGCMLRNGGRKSTLTVETRADIIRETDLLGPEAARQHIEEHLARAEQHLIDAGIGDGHLAQLLEYFCAKPH